MEQSSHSGPTEYYRQQWVRGEYQIADGCIVPAPGATFTRYDVIGEDNSSRASLAAFAGRRLVYDLLNLDEYDDQAVLRFVNHHGLLGVFQQRFYCWCRSGPGDADDPADLQAAIFTSAFSEIPELAPVEEYYPRYVRRRADGSYPRPDSPDLWESLCEPLDDFRQYAQCFKGAYGATAMKHTPEDRYSIEVVLLMMQSSLQRITQAIEYRDGVWRLVWCWPSLICAAYFLLASDFTAQHIPGRCGKCGNWFPQTRQDKRFCSKGCQLGQAARRRRQRVRCEAASSLERAA